MNAESICAYHYATGQPVLVSWDNDRITRIEPAPSNPPRDTWIAPPLLDLQINGYAGVDFQQDDLTAEQLLTAVRALRRDGCTRFLVTLITDEWPRLLARLRHLSQVRASQPELAEAILGWHIEGPFLSPEPGFCGAHDPAVMLDPLPAHIDALREIAGSEVLLLTVAPERAGAREAILHARHRGVFVHFGHTNASREQLRAAAGEVSAFTHLGNACPQQLDRHDNILWRVLDLPELWCSVIADGIHVSPPLFRLIHQVKGDQVFYTTDAMSAAGAPPGRYALGKLEVEVGADGVVRQPGRTNFAGSSCTPLQAVRRAADMMDEPWQKAWKRLSDRPARVIGVEGGLAEGAPASFCVAVRGHTTGQPDAATWKFQTYYHGQPWPR